MSRSNQSGYNHRSTSRTNQPTPPQTTTTITSTGQQSALEALLSLDSSIGRSSRERGGRDFSVQRPSISRRLSTSGSRSRDRGLNTATTSESTYSSLASGSAISQFGTPPPTLVPNLSNKWLQRERLAQQQGAGGTSGFWGGTESLPSNAVAGYSAFNTFADGSHFFPPGGSAFSFEGGLSGGREGEEDSPSLFRDSRIKSSLRSSSRHSIPDSSTGGQRSGDNTSWEEDEVINKRSGIGIMGGGRKRKDSSRGLCYVVTTSNMTVDKGLVALARPSGEGADSRVAIAGKTCLRILKVPSGETSASSFERPSSAFKSFSGLAARRSQARGSPVSQDRNLTPDDKASILGEKIDGSSNNEIVETLDVRFGSRLGPSFFFSDVKWGYGATSGKIATAFSNGAVVLWDLAKEGSSRVDQLKYEHDRAVNRVVFGGASGSWLLSGGQDGQMKLWDIREARPASLVLKASSPVRQLSFSPSASQPFTLLSVLSSGTLIRYDIRYTGRVAGGATDRIAGHVGACLAMDWRDNLPSESNRAAGGWVVTGGMDNTIKIWDFSLTTLSTKPATTLFASQPVQSVSWHPTRATELASSPLPTLSVGTDEGSNSPGFNSTGMELGGGKEALGSSWKNEIEIWDTRRSFFPKLSIKTDEPVSAIVYNDDDTIWSTSKSTPTFQQFDVNSDSYAMIDSMPTAGASWSIEGELIFVDDARSPHDIPWDPPNILNTSVASIENSSFRPTSSVGSVLNFDPDFSANSFTYLANNLVLAGSSLGEICDINAEASEYVGRSDAAQLWSTIRIWFDEAPLFSPEPETESEVLVAPEVEYQTPQISQIPLPTSTPPFRANDTFVTTSPLFDVSTATIVPPSRRSFSTSLNRTRSIHNSPVILPTVDSPKISASSNNYQLDDFSEESASEVDIILPPASIPASSDSFNRLTYNPDQLSTSSGSESVLSTTGPSKSIPTGTSTSLSLSGGAPRSHTNLFSAAQVGTRRGRSMTLSTGLVGPSTPSRLLGSMLDLDAKLQQRRSSTPTPGNIGLLKAINIRGEDDWEFDSPPSGITSKLSTPWPLSVEPNQIKSRIIDTSSDSDDDSDDNRDVEGKGEGGGEGDIAEVEEDEKYAKVRAAKLLARQSTMIRRSSGGSKTRPALNGSNGTSILGLSRQSSINQRVGLYSNEEKKDSQELVKGPSMKVLKRLAGGEQVSELNDIVKEQILASLIEYANRGDSQLCASVCCVLAEQGFGFDLMFVARVTKAYLDLLRRSKLFASAAGLLKYCAIESLRSQTQNNIVHHMACGKCGKAIEQPPYGTCHRCSNQITRCCICHLIVRSLLLFCPICNHGAHLNCVTSTSAILSSRLESLNSLSSSPYSLTHHHHKNTKEDSPNISHPSTPGLPVTSNSAMPAIRAWFWNEDGNAVEGSGLESNTSEEMERKEIESLIGRCPGCSHAGCLLAVAVE